jgi:anaerobic selenocysteine-containing dehydrogenase/Fe-S-cluster-containing dehydrogenase component
MKRALDKLDLLVVVDPYPSATAAMANMPAADGTPPNPNRSVYLLPAATQFETSGSCTASNRSLQWREKVIEPLFESQPDHVIMQAFADRLGFGKELSKNLKITEYKRAGMTWREPEIESILREINRSNWTIGYTGQSPERLKAHMRNMHLFDVRTLRCKGGKDPETGYDLTGDYFGLPWPCYGTPELKHPGSPNLYDTSRHVMDGGGNFRANFGVERDGVSLLAEDGSHSLGAELTTGYPEFDHVFLKKLGWWGDLTDAEKKAADGKNWKTDLSGGIQRVAMKHGCHPFGNAKARAIVWNFPDAIPQHREPLYSTRPDMVAKYPTHDDKKAFWRLPTLYKTVQQRNIENKVYEKFPIILTSGRLVEYEGGGEETRSNPWLAELQQENFVEINPKAAADRGIRHNDYVWVKTPTGAQIKVRALVTERVGADHAFIPFHFSGWWQGKDLLDYYPEGAHPIVRGEAINTATTYGYDAVTMMQETKTTVCQIERCIECNACATACKNEHEVPWGVNRRRVVTINDGMVGAEKSISVACMHCSDAPCMAVCPVDCFYRTEDGVVLHDKDVCIGCGYCSYACPFGAPQFPSQGTFGVRGKMDKCTFCAGGPEAHGSEAEFEKYGRNRLAEGKLPLCAEMCSTKALLGGDGDVIADILRNRVMKRGKGAELFGWGTAYGGAGKSAQAAPAAPAQAAPVAPEAPTSGAY